MSHSGASLPDPIARLRISAADEPGLIATMVRHQYARDHMTEQEVVAGNTQLVFAGNETTAKLLAQIVVTLADHPDQRRAVRSDRSLIPPAVEEVHRYETITHSVFRDVIADDVSAAGVAIPNGARIKLLLLGAANRGGNAPTSSTCPARSCPTSATRSGCTAVSA